MDNWGNGYLYVFRQLMEQKEEWFAMAGAEQ
jgi:hypothetical protein